MWFAALSLADICRLRICTIPRIAERGTESGDEFAWRAESNSIRRMVHRTSQRYKGLPGKHPADPQCMRSCRPSGWHTMYSGGQVTVAAGAVRLGRARKSEPPMLLLLSSYLLCRNIGRIAHTAPMVPPNCVGFYSQTQDKMMHRVRFYTVMISM